MNNNDKKRKVLQSLSAFAFALTVFAANSQGGGVSAETIDLAGGMAKSSVSDSQQEDGSSEEAGNSDENVNGGDADSIATTYGSENQNNEGSDSTGSEDANVESADSEGTGSEDTNTDSTDYEGTGSEDTNADSTDSEGTGSENANTETTDYEGTGSEDTNADSTDSEGTGSENANTETTDYEGTGSENANTESTDSEGTGSEDTNTESTDSEESSDADNSSQYSQLGDNAYLLTGNSSTASSLLDKLNAIKDYAIYSNTINTGNHIEGNVCTNSVNNFDLFNTNVAQHQTNQDGSNSYICYVDSFEQLTGDTKLGVYDGTTYEIVLGFEADCVADGNNYIITYTENGEAKTKKLAINGNINDVTVRSLGENEAVDINQNLGNIASDGEAMRKEIAYNAQGTVNPFKTVSEALNNANGNSVSGNNVVVINATVDQINSDDTFNNGWLKTILDKNNGANIIINVQTDGMDDISFKNVNPQSWSSSNANVIFNFGGYKGNISVQNWGGVIVAPNASLHNANNIEGSVIVDTFNQGGEVHQVTSNGYEISVPDNSDESDNDDDAETKNNTENGSDDNGDNGSDDNDDNGSDDGDDNGSDDNNDNGSDDNDDNGSDDSGDNGSDDNGSDDNDDNGSDDNGNNGSDDNGDNGSDDNGDNGSDDNDDNGSDDNGDNGSDDNSDNGSDDNDDNGSDDNGDNGSDDNGDNGSDDNGDNVSDDNGDNGSDDNDDNGSDDNNDNGSDDNNDNGSDDNNDNGSDDNGDNGSDDNSDNGSDDNGDIPVTPDVPSTPNVPIAPNVPSSSDANAAANTSSDSAAVSYIEIEESDVPLADFIDMEDPDVPLGDFIDVEDPDVPLTDSEISNPKTGEDLTPVYMAAFGEIISAAVLIFAARRKYDGSKYEK